MPEDPRPGNPESDIRWNAAHNRWELHRRGIGAIAWASHLDHIISDAHLADLDPRMPSRADVRAYKEYAQTRPTGDLSPEIVGQPSLNVAATVELWALPGGKWGIAPVGADIAIGNFSSMIEARDFALQCGLEVHGLEPPDEPTAAAEIGPRPGGPTPDAAMADLDDVPSPGPTFDPMEAEASPEPPMGFGPSAPDAHADLVRGAGIDPGTSPNDVAAAVEQHEFAVSAARDWAEAYPHAEASATAAEQMARAEARLSEIHPEAMAHYNELRSQGRDPAEAMMEAAPIFDHPPAPELVASDVIEPRAALRAGAEQEARLAAQIAGRTFPNGPNPEPTLSATPSGHRPQKQKVLQKVLRKGR